MTSVRILSMGLLAAALILGGCGTTSQTQALVQNSALAPEVGMLRVSLSEAARERLRDNEGFNQAQLETTLRNDLISRKLLKSASGQQLEVVVTDLRVRHGAAVYFGGPFSGKDHVVADVLVKDISGRVIKSAKVNVSFRLASIGSIGTDQRNAQMYELFARHVAAVVDPSIPAE